MKSIKGISSPQSGIFRKLAIGMFLLAIFALFIGGQQGAPRQVQSTNTEQEVTVQDILEFDIVSNIGGQRIPGGSSPVQSSYCATPSDYGLVNIALLISANTTDANTIVHNIKRELMFNTGEIGGPSNGTTVPKHTLQGQLHPNLSKGEIGGPGNQGMPRAYMGNNVEIGGQQGAPRGYANLDSDIGGPQNAPRGFYGSIVSQ